MKNLVMNTTRACPNFIRAIVILLSLTIALISLGLEPDCCGGGATKDPCIFEGPCPAAKQTMVSWTLRGEGDGTVTVAAYYAKTPAISIVETKLVFTQASPPEAKKVCGSFCADTNFT